MSRLTRWARRSAGLGVTLAVFALFLPDLLYGVPAVGAIAELWWLFLAVALLLEAGNRFGVQVPGLRTASTIQREDIIEPTNWARTGTYDLRQSYGIALTISALIALVVSLIVGNLGLAMLWMLALFVGVVWIVTAWRFGLDIAADHTKTLSVRAPDLFSAHNFHVALRQTAENFGYTIEQETSPEVGGQSATHDEDIFHAKGGFKARRRPIEASRTLVPELEDDPYMSSILTTATAGVFGLLVGITTLASANASLELVLTTEQFDIVYVVGPVLLLGGLTATVYDYYTRTREWGELYCVEEGTIHASTANIYDERTLDAMDSHAEPTVTSAETSAVISVTVGAKCTSLYDTEELEADFEAFVEEIERAAAENQLTVVEDRNPPDDPRPQE